MHKIYLYSFIIVSFASVLLGIAYSAVSSPSQKANMIMMQAHASYIHAQESDEILNARRYIQSAIDLAQQAQIYNPASDVISKEILFFQTAHLELKNNKTNQTL